jgi:hypothetical protein
MKNVSETIQPKVQLRTALDFLVEKAEKLGMIATAEAIGHAIKIATGEIGEAAAAIEERKEG